MKWENVADMTIGYEVGNLAVAVAGDVLQGSVACRTLVQALDRHDREELVDCPTVWQALEQGEVAEILVCKNLIQSSELLRHMLHVLGKVVDLVAHAPVHRLNLGTGLQIYDAVREELQCLVANLLGIVPVFQHIARIQIIPYLIKVLHQLVVGFLCLKLLWHFRQGSSLQYINHQYGVVCRERAATLGDEVRMLDIVLVGCINESIDTVVHILLDRVVYGALAAGRAGAVVIYAKTTTAIYEIYIVAHLVEVDVELCSLTESRLDAADLGNLASDVEVDEAQAVVESHLLNLVEGGEQFGTCQTELRCIATALSPFSRA